MRTTDKSSTTSAVRSMNLHSVYRYIRENGPVSKQDIQRGLEMSLPTITRNLRDLEKRQLLTAVKAAGSGGGRSALLYSADPGGKYAIGLYLTGQHIHAAAVDLRGETRLSEIIPRPFEPGSEDYLRFLGTVAEEIREKAGIPGEKLLGVGIAVQSLIDEKGESVVYGFTHNFTGTTRQQLSRYILRPTGLYHDSYVAGFAEVWARPEMKDAIYISLNDSVGGSVILGDRIYEGTNRRAGEIGHMRFDPRNEKKCYCGKTGCFNTECNSLLLAEKAGGSLEAFFEGLEQGEEDLQAVWRDYLLSLSRAIHNLHIFFDCPIIIGGAVGAYIEKSIDELRAMTAALDPFGEPAEAYCLPCQCRTEATAAGAALMLISDFIGSVAENE